jgi:hypothetical protein
VAAGFSIAGLARPAMHLWQPGVRTAVTRGTRTPLGLVQGQIVYRGKAALPVPMPFFDRFAKVVAVPRGGDGCAEPVGRVDMAVGPLGSALYPLYFRLAASPALCVPGACHLQSHLAMCAAHTASHCVIRTSDRDILT